MQKKKNYDTGGLVYSTDPTFKINQPQDFTATTLPASEQILKVLLDKKNRAGKSVTLVTGFTGKQEDAEEIGKKLKTICGTGGSVKDGEIIIQGDNLEKIFQWLLKNGYNHSKKI